MMTYDRGEIKIKDLRTLISVAEDVNTLISMGEYEYSPLNYKQRETFEKLRSFFIAILDEYGEEWSGKNPDFPNNPYYTGYKYKGYIFVTNYTGLAGRHWGDRFCFEIYKEQDDSHIPCICDSDDVEELIIEEE